LVIGFLQAQWLKGSYSFAARAKMMTITKLRSSRGIDPFPRKIAEAIVTHVGQSSQKVGWPDIFHWSAFRLI
jgi:hypothetical protein